MKRLLSFLLVITLILTTSVTTLATTINREAEEHIFNQLSRANIPNAAIAVIQGGETSYIFKDSEYNTLFQIGSVAKSFTGFGVLLLEDMGLLSVTDPVNQHLPWFDVRYNGVLVPHEDITIYNLLHHTSGLTSDERYFPAILGGALTKDEVIAELIGIELSFYPSTLYGYGNINYVILGFIIEAVSGQSYDEFMTEYVLHPLSLYNTFTDMQRAHESGRVIGGNRLGFFQVRPWNPPVSPVAVPAMFIYSGITDMARWAGIHLGTVEISEQFARVVQRSHEHNYASNAPFADMDYFYGAGWQVDSAASTVVHAGDTMGYSAIISMCHYSDTAVAIVVNLNYMSMRALSNIILDAMQNGVYNSVRMDLRVIFDTVFTILTTLGAVYIGLFMRLIIKSAKRLRNGEVIKVNFTSKNIKGLVDPIIMLAVAVGFYVVPSMLTGNTHTVTVLFSPASITLAEIAIWVMVAYSWCSFFAIVFGISPVKEKKPKNEPLG